jgi:hypothetical protein
VDPLLLCRRPCHPDRAIRGRSTQALVLVLPETAQIRVIRTLREIGERNKNSPGCEPIPVGHERPPRDRGDISSGAT